MKLSPTEKEAIAGAIEGFIEARKMVQWAFVGQTSMPLSQAQNEFKEASKSVWETIEQVMYERILDAQNP